MIDLLLLVCAASLGQGKPDRAEVPYPESVPAPPGSPPHVYRQLAVSARDGARLIVHEWAPVKAAGEKPVVLFLHGIGMHGEPYGSVAPGFTSRGLVFVVPDLRGHGRSQGKRGELAEPHVLRADLGAVIDLIHQRYPGAPVVLAGESMGGLLAADYAWRGEQRLAGLALLAPAFGLNWAQVKPGSGLKELFAGRVSLEDGGKLADSTREPGFIKARRADELALHEVELSYLAVLARLQAEVPLGAAEVKLPLFVAVGEKDRIIDNGAAKTFLDRAGTPKEEKVYRKYDKACHTLCWDPVTPELVEELAKWALRQAK
jgi:alpha-beta hydrolase superfamily lysophospholipase